MTYVIIARFKGTSTPWSPDEQVIDSSDDLGIVRRLVEDYKLAYGPAYYVYYRREEVYARKAR